MKIAVVLLALLPFALSMSVEKRFLDFGFNHLIDIQFIKQKVQQILDDAGSDVSEQRCEAICHNTFAVDESHLVHTVCIPLCKSFQSLVNLFGLRPRHTYYSTTGSP